MRRFLLVLLGCLRVSLGVGMVVAVYRVGLVTAIACLMVAPFSLGFGFRGLQSPF